MRVISEPHGNYSKREPPDLRWGGDGVPRGMATLCQDVKGKGNKLPAPSRWLLGSWWKSGPKMPPAFSISAAAFFNMSGNSSEDY